MICVLLSSLAASDSDVELAADISNSGFSGKHVWCFPFPTGYSECDRDNTRTDCSVALRLSCACECLVDETSEQILSHLDTIAFALNLQ